MHMDMKERARRKPASERKELRREFKRDAVRVRAQKPAKAHLRPGHERERRKEMLAEPPFIGIGNEWHKLRPQQLIPSGLQRPAGRLLVTDEESRLRERPVQS